MQGFEIFAMIVTLVLIALVVVVKVVTAQMVNRMKVQIAQVVHIRQDALNRLKSVQSQKGVIDQNQRMLNDKKAKLAKRIARIKQEIAEMEKEEEARKQRVSMRKVDMEDEP
jgi:endonuclease/exonuclease/phosphatase (EEP) superfamily protein YafD